MITVKRVELPSGGWWEIETRPRWRHLQEWRAGSREASSRPAHLETELVDRVLVSLTTAWSFDLPITIDRLGSIDDEDVLVLLEVVRSEVASRWRDFEPKAAAESLLSSLAAGRAPDEFREAHIMALTGWSWETLQQTPADVVERMVAYVSVTRARATGGALDFREVDHDE